MKTQIMKIFFYRGRTFFLFLIFFGDNIRSIKSLGCWNELEPCFNSSNNTNILLHCIIDISHISTTGCLMFLKKLRFNIGMTFILISFHLTSETCKILSSKLPFMGIQKSATIGYVGWRISSIILKLCLGRKSQSLNIAKMGIYFNLPF